MSTEETNARTERAYVVTIIGMWAIAAVVAITTVVAVRITQDGPETHTSPYDLPTRTEFLRVCEEDEVIALVPEVEGSVGCVHVEDVNA